MRNDNFQLLKQGHPDSLVNIHAQYSSRIFWIGKRLIRDEFVIENLVQDTFLKLWEHRDTIQSADHIFFFLRFVMKRECISYYTRPRNRFYRQFGHLENYENHQDYFAGHDPLEEAETAIEQDQQENDLKMLKEVLPLINPAQKQVIELCLIYGFQYKVIAEIIGTSTKKIYHETKKAIQVLKTILNEGKINIESNTNASEAINENQQMVFELRFKKHHSFTEIANKLNLTQKEVHAAFTAAYKVMQEHDGQLESA
ncbi:MAG: sigma-70 family RNA polymerase sigma factor [Christiangramia sp.]|uniref:RNA polymerase sigma factor n=1 Tax=Christiangramia sp. TaxID=1931228 RepID=UPI0032424A7B